MAPVSITTYQTIDGIDYAVGTVVQFPEVLSAEIEERIEAGLISPHYDPFSPVFDHETGAFSAPANVEESRHIDPADVAADKGDDAEVKD